MPTNTEKEFEDFLKEKHGENYHGTDDDMPDAYEQGQRDLVGEKVETKGTGGDETMTGSPDTLISLNWLVGEIEGMKIDYKDPGIPIGGLDIHFKKAMMEQKIHGHNSALTTLQERIRSNKE
jgi:hypothetical protein